MRFSRFLASIMALLMPLAFASTAIAAGDGQDDQLLGKAEVLRYMKVRYGRSFEDYGISDKGKRAVRLNGKSYRPVVVMAGYEQIKGFLVDDSRRFYEILLVGAKSNPSEIDGERAEISCTASPQRVTFRKAFAVPDLVDGRLQTTWSTAELRLFSEGGAVRYTSLLDGKRVSSGRVTLRLVK